MFIAPRSRQRVVPLRMIVPNLLTTVALCSGLASIHYSLKGDWDRALMAVGVAALFDMLDGRAARLLRASSPFGAVMDSLSDFLAFGIAPAILLHQWMLKDEDVWGLAAVMTFVLCAALRLARFTAAARPPARTVRPNPLATKFFVGMPTPAAAAAVLVPPMLETSRTWTRHAERLEGWLQPWMVVLFTFLVAGLMISRIPMFSFKRLHVKRRLVAPFLVAVGLVVVMAARDLWLTLSLVALTYLLTFPLSMYLHRRAAAHAMPSPHDPGSDNSPDALADLPRHDRTGIERRE